MPNWRGELLILAYAFAGVEQGETNFVWLVENEKSKMAIISTSKGGWSRVAIRPRFNLANMFVSCSFLLLLSLMLMLSILLFLGNMFRLFYFVVI